MDYPLEGDVYEFMRSVNAKTICSDFDEQLDSSEALYKENIKFYFTKKDVSCLLDTADIYSEDVRKRVENILYTQMRKYQYLFVTD